MARLNAQSIQVERIFAWTGPVLLIALFFALVVLCDLWPPTPPSWTAEQVKAFYVKDVVSKRIGLAICLCVWTLMLPWGIALAAQTARLESGFRILSVTQVACAATFMVIGELMFLVWGLNAFRPDELPAETMRMLNDLSWFIFVMYWAPGTLWCWAIGVAIHLDRSEKPAFARWVAYFCYWVGLIFFPACMGLFFKDGPFAYNGLITVWIPAGVFFLWYGVMSYLMLKAIRRREAMMMFGVDAR